LRPRGTHRYMAPEVFRSNPNAKKEISPGLSPGFVVQSDIYSLSMVFWELIYRVICGVYLKPFSEFKNISVEAAVSTQAAFLGRRPTIPMNTPKMVENLIVSSWHSAPQERPEIQKVLEILEGIGKEYELNRTTWDPLVKKNSEITRIN